jgi:hypothetical protein
MKARIISDDRDFGVVCGGDEEVLVAKACRRIRRRKPVRIEPLHSSAAQEGWMEQHEAVYADGDSVIVNLVFLDGGGRILRFRF